MKKTFWKAAALAMVLAAPSISMAAVTTTIDLEADPTGVNTFASEISYTDANPLVGGANEPNFSAEIGFGVSNGQTRYIRLQYGNATLDAAHAAVLATDLEDATTAGALDGAGGAAAVVQGGAIGDNYVIYQITAGADIASTDVMDFLVPNLRVTSTSSPVTVNMQLHETAVSAVAGSTGAGLLYSKSGNLAEFDNGLDFILEPNANTAAVTTLFMEFCDAAGDCTAANADQTKAIGGITFDVNGALTRNGAAVALNGLVTTANLTVTGDFTAAAAEEDVFIDNNGGCDDVDVTGTMNEAKTSVVFAVDNTAIPAGGELCYTADGATVIPVQTINAALDVLTAPADVTATDYASSSAGTIAHDGTVLKAPYMRTRSGQNTYANFVNTGTTDAPYTVRCFTPTAVSDGNTGTITAETTKKMGVSGLGCPNDTTSVEITIATPAGNVNGSITRENVTTGDLGLDGMVGNE